MVIFFPCISAFYTYSLTEEIHSRFSVHNYGQSDAKTTWKISNWPYAWYLPLPQFEHQIIHNGFVVFSSTPLVGEDFSWFIYHNFKIIYLLRYSFLFPLCFQKNGYIIMEYWNKYISLNLNYDGKQNSLFQKFDLLLALYVQSM